MARYNLAGCKSWHNREGRPLGNSRGAGYSRRWCEPAPAVAQNSGRGRVLSKQLMPGVMHIHLE